MIKIETTKGISTFTFDNNPVEVFAGMELTSEALLTLKTTEEVVYSIDELVVVSVDSSGTRTYILGTELDTTTAPPSMEPTGNVEKTEKVTSTVIVPK